MKRIKTIVLALFCTVHMVSASDRPMYTFYLSDNDEKEKIFYAGVGVVFGIFFPGTEDLNDYIENDRPYGTSSTMGTSDMLTNFNLKLSLTVRPRRIIEIVPFCEFGLAPKQVGLDYENFYYYFIKLSPGFTARIHIPFGSGRHSLFFAPGITYNLLSFRAETGPISKAGGLGGRFNVGFNFGLSKMNIQPFLGYDYARTVDKDVNFEELALNFSSVQLGVDFNF